jgi:hypothetical protein
MSLVLSPSNLKHIAQQMSIEELTDESSVDLFSIACENDEYIETTKLIIQKGKDVNKHFRYSTPYLHLAITHLCLNTCQLLIESGIDINLKYRKKTPLKAAMLDINAFRIARLLIFHGCDINIRLKTRKGECDLVTYILPEVHNYKHAVLMKSLLERNDVYLPPRVCGAGTVDYALHIMSHYNIAKGLVRQGAKWHSIQSLPGHYTFNYTNRVFGAWYDLVYVKIAIMSVKMNTPNVFISLLDKDTRRKLCSFLV